jgi:hypothetical protein
MIESAERTDTSTTPADIEQFPPPRADKAAGQQTPQTTQTQPETTNSAADPTQAHAYAYTYTYA